MGTELTTWTTDVTGNPALTGEFMWTGVDYMGEAGWRVAINFGGNGALLDEMGTPRSLAFSWQTTWGAHQDDSTRYGSNSGQGDAHGGSHHDNDGRERRLVREGRSEH
jgi:hypothetical protein